MKYILGNLLGTGHRSCHWLAASYPKLVDSSHMGYRGPSTKYFAETRPDLLQYYRKQAISILYINLIGKTVFCYIIQVDKLHIDELPSSSYYKYTYTGEDTAQNSYGRTYAGR